MIETIFNIDIFSFEDGDCCEEGYNYFDVEWKLSSLKEYNGCSITLNQNQDIKVYNNRGTKVHEFNLIDNEEFRDLLIKNIESKKIDILPTSHHYESTGEAPYIKCCKNCKDKFKLL